MPDRLITDGRLRGLLYAFMVVTLAAMVATMIAVLVIVNSTNQRGKDNRQIIETISDTNEAILDCTEAPGKCYVESQTRSSEAIVGINGNTFRTIVAALSCQEDGITEEEALAKCTVQRAKKVAVPE